MAGIDLSRMAPGDAETALRSYSRRYREVFATLSGPDGDGEDVDDIAHRMGPNGLSALDIVDDLTRTWSLLHDGVNRIVTTDTPILHAGVIDATERHWPTGATESVSIALDLLSDEAVAFADQVARVSLENWNRTASVADSTGVTSVSALDLLREAIRIGHDGLDTTAQALRAARS